MAFITCPLYGIPFLVKPVENQFGSTTLILLKGTSKSEANTRDD
jgi:hypothetical protein